MDAHEVKILNVTANVPFKKAYEFAHRPENFPKWAAGLSTSLKRDGDDWKAETPAGTAVIQFSDYNQYGVLDHRVKLDGKPEVYIPLRMIENGKATEIVFVLYRQPEMDDAAFRTDIQAVQKDINSLKSLLERLP